MRKTMALAAALMLAPVSAGADDAHWMFVKYREYQQVTIPCTLGLQCTVDFAPGEILGDVFNADPGDWKMSESYSANRLPKGATPELVALNATPEDAPAELRARALKKRTNLVVWARNTMRKYRLLFVPTSDERPTYVVFLYDAPPAPKANPAPKASARAIRKAAPLTLSQVVDNACRTMRDSYTADGATDRHGRVDPVLASIRPIRICRDFAHTYLQMPQSDAAVSDLPVVFEDSPAGLTQVVAPYEERSRIFTVNTTANVLLRITIGKRIAEMHVKRRGNG
jgi:type IV secretory pathway VirB9-like protein